MAPGNGRGREFFPIDPISLSWYGAAKVEHICELLMHPERQPLLVMQD